MSASLSAVARALWSSDHKLVAKRYLWSGLIFLLLGGLLAMLVRWQWAFPGQPVPAVGRLLFPHSAGAISPEAYPKLFTMHGVIMIFFAITPLLIGTLSNFLIPLQIGARGMAFPRLNALSFWVFAISQLLVLCSFVTPLGTASAGWTSYPPLATQVGTPGNGQSLVVLALFINGASTVMGAASYVTTVIRLRAPGMDWMRLPATTWGLFLTAILNVLFAPVLASAAVLLLLDRHASTQFFIAGSAAIHGGGDPLAYQHLFWIFGHPEVYILILPAWGVVTDVVSFFSRQPAYGWRLTVGSMIAITVLSGLVYGHHMYVSGMSPLLGQGFMALTLAVSIPSLVLGLNWLQTLWRGAVRLDTPMLYALGVIFVFGLGGLTGLFLADMSTDVYLHDTLFVVGHFHMIMAAATFLAVFAALHFWFPKMFARHLDERLGKLHFWSSATLLVLVFAGQMLAGYAGQPRRLYDPYQYVFVQRLLPLNRLTSYLAFALLAAQLLFIVNFFKTIFGKQAVAAPNPWRVGTLEWSCTSTPVAPGNFEGPVVVHCGPHEFADFGAGRDLRTQAEAV
jgi:cytochrome c oxidase subunit 1